ncbi:DASH family cryptochrome [Undibacterium terreum]|uniref:DASH family cryptochrome n=1 Tax=Undibacterium terreum TaxID=1224302 RepID=UPI00280BB791|nr:DASH family cryptochrome [Undibacterium terreum]
MTTLIYWFRNDLRLHDNLALHAACNKATRLLPVYCHDHRDDNVVEWGFRRVGPHRKHFLASALADLRSQLRTHGSRLLEIYGEPRQMLFELAQLVGATGIVCDDVAAPEEQDEVQALIESGLNVEPIWQSSLLSLAELPFTIDGMPDIFTTFRQLVEAARTFPHPPMLERVRLPPLPTLASALSSRTINTSPLVAVDPRSSFPYHAPSFWGGENAGLAHLDRYFDLRLAHSYKLTRNNLTGTDYSTKFSPWLAQGAISPRTVYAALQNFEEEHGANEGTYWVWFELLWRDYFRFLHLKYGRKLYRATGLSEKPLPSHDADAFLRWRRGVTGEPLVDAGMRELAATGYLSNRLRQVVASYLVHELQCDWRAGAAWFESQLIDYDPYSNQGTGYISVAAVPIHAGEGV